MAYVVCKTNTLGSSLREQLRRLGIEFDGRGWRKVSSVLDSGSVVLQSIDGRGFRIALERVPVEVYVGTAKPENFGKGVNSIELSTGKMLPLTEGHIVRRETLVFADGSSMEILNVYHRAFMRDIDRSLSVVVSWL
jgi:hypothetical protein